MPFYVYSCPQCGEFEKRAGFEDSSLSCRCGGRAQRAPFSGSAGIVVAGRHLPTDPVEKEQHTFKELRKSGWDGDRAMTLVRKNVKTNPEGHKFLDVKAMNANG